VLVRRCWDFLDYLILPQNRTDNTVALQPTTPILFQIETLEPYIRSFDCTDFDGNSNGTTVLQTLINAAEMNVTGTAGAKSPVYADIVSVLRCENKAAGLIGTLGGALLKGMGLEGLAGLADLIPI